MSESAAARSATPGLLALRGAFGGTLMGLANLVPGISGGTMLLSAGVYPEFIRAIAEVTTLRLRARSLLLLGSVVGAAAIAILLLAGTVRDLVVEQRFIMYSLFIGLTLGGAPIVWRLARPMSAGVALGAAGGLAVMIALALGDPAGSSGAAPAYGLLFVAGLLGASAMILPGVSGGYLLLLLGQYVPILSAVSDFKDGLLASPPDVGLALGAVKVGLPVGLGVLIGAVGVSNLIRWLLDHHRKPTLGLLLGLLLGAVLGLWPFQRAVPPEPGQTIKGVVVTADNRDGFDLEDWPTERFPPTAGQVALCLALIGGGFALTQALGRLGDAPRDL